MIQLITLQAETLSYMLSQLDEYKIELLNHLNQGQRILRYADGDDLWTGNTEVTMDELQVRVDRIRDLIQQIKVEREEDRYPSHELCGHED
jgi:hypothetical protein